MQLIEVNSFIPYIQKAPHKIYVLELSLDELSAFKIHPQETLRRFAAFVTVDDKTNLHVDAIDGDKGGYSHSNVGVTHGIVMDFRPLMIKVVFWAKPPSNPQAIALTNILPAGPIATITA